MRRPTNRRLWSCAPLALLIPLAIGCSDDPMPSDIPPAEELPPDPPICSPAPPVATAAGTCKGPTGDPLPCDEAHRFCKEKYSIPHLAGMTRVELRGNYRPLGWDVGYPLTLSTDGKTWEGERRSRRLRPRTRADTTTHCSSCAISAVLPARQAVGSVRAAPPPAARWPTGPGERA
jgi:hypothetical protein